MQRDAVGLSKRWLNVGQLANLLGNAVAHVVPEMDQISFRASGDVEAWASRLVGSVDAQYASCGIEDKTCLHSDCQTFETGNPRNAHSTCSIPDRALPRRQPQKSRAEGLI